MKITTKKQIREILKVGAECDLEYPTFLCRLQDDTDGEKDPKHALILSQGRDGDMHVKIGDGKMFLRFRTREGGGLSLATHNALRILAEAIIMDQEWYDQKD